MSFSSRSQQSLFYEALWLKQNNPMNGSYCLIFFSLIKTSFLNEQLLNKEKKYSKRCDLRHHKIDKCYRHTHSFRFDMKIFLHLNRTKIEEKNGEEILLWFVFFCFIFRKWHLYDGWCVSPAYSVCAMWLNASWWINLKKSCTRVYARQHLSPQSIYLNLIENNRPKRKWRRRKENIKSYSWFEF